jgi:hypothetical protein
MRVGVPEGSDVRLPATDVTKSGRFITRLTGPVPEAEARFTETTVVCPETTEKVVLPVSRMMDVPLAAVTVTVQLPTARFVKVFVPAVSVPLAVRPPGPIRLYEYPAIRRDSSAGRRVFDRPLPSFHPVLSVTDPLAASSPFDLKRSPPQEPRRKMRRPSPRMRTGMGMVFVVVFISGS